MDCRVSPVAWRRWLWRRFAAPVTCVGLGLAAGCTHLQGTTVPNEPPPDAAAKDDKPKHRREPKPITCVACGDARLQLIKSGGNDRRQWTVVEKEDLYEQARRCYEQAIHLDAKCFAAYLGLSRMYQQREDFARAREAIDEGLKECPGEAALWFERGMCCARQKDWDASLESLQQACNFEPENRVYANMLGYGLARAGRYDESYALFEKSQGAAKAHYNVARMLHHVHKDEDSKRHLRLALAAKPDLAGARELLVELDAPVEPAGGAAVPAALLEPGDFDSAPAEAAPKQ